MTISFAHAKHYFFEQFLKIHKKFNFDQNQPKLSTQHKYMYMYQKKL